ncbi:MAG: cytochrome c-type biogenesis protein [Gemmatimonadota bacterium]
MRAIGAIGALLFAPALLTAQIANDSVLEARTSEVAATLRCPVCQGLSLNDSPSELSLQMRAVVKDQLRAGKSPEQVKAYFASKYGEWILLEPKAEGINLIVYFAPLALLLAGGALIVVMVRKWTAAGATNAMAAPEDELL